MTSIFLPGVNIQAPWAELIISGRKSVETRYYPMPAKWEGEPMVIIETPGKKSRFRSRVAGLVIFGKSYVYESRQLFIHELSMHLVEPDDPVFGWSDDNKPKWGWPVLEICRYSQALPLGFRRGIRYAKAVPITEPPVDWLERVVR